ncbi:MAG: type II toxin-antitoxin system RelE/ParE family toxin [Flavobacteriales bacterium]|nr:type II toxin-antitoxin system RelE/ParE family toxin [Flavobacteriales bacterium]
MALTVKWTPRAEDSFEAIVTYLEEHWTDREVRNFLNESNRVIGQVAVMPLMFRKSEKKGIHEAVIAPRCLLIYRVRADEVHLLAFFDTRMNPKRKLRGK